uniref:HD domain-containing protein n=1 Tax=Parastrongyloides trichosuri TaxID=131310 RepID=A0A0N4ZPP9_PARTI
MESEGSDNIKMIIKATEFTARKHRFNCKDDNKAEGMCIYQQVGTAWILVNEGHINNPTILTAALLHDLTKNTTTTLKEIKDDFDKDVISILEEFEVFKNLPSDGKRNFGDESILIPKLSYESKLIYMAELLCYIRQLNNDRTIPLQLVQAYYQRAKKCINITKGTNKYLEIALDNVIRTRRRSTITNNVPFADKCRIS